MAGDEGSGDAMADDALNGVDDVSDDGGLDDDALGEPIEELRTLEVEPPTGFVFRVLNILRRRDLSRQLATMSWTGLAAVFVEFLQMIYSVFEPTPRDEKEPNDAAST